MNHDDALKLFQILATVKVQGPISRKNLATRLETGEGVMRRLLDRLEIDGLIIRKKRGVIFSQASELLLSDIQVKEIVIDLQGLAVDLFNTAILIVTGAIGLRYGLEQRDSAVRAGASGATTLVYKDSKLRIPSHPTHTPVKIGITRYFQGLFQLEEGSIILIGSGPSYVVGERGALAAAFTLLPDLKGSLE